MRYHTSVTGLWMAVMLAAGCGDGAGVARQDGLPGTPGVGPAAGPGPESMGLDGPAGHAGAGGSMDFATAPPMAGTDDDPGAMLPPADGQQMAGPGGPITTGCDVPAAATTPIEAPTPIGCITAVTAGLQNLACEGVGFALNVPAQCLTHACGVIADVHGQTMNSEIENGNTNLRALGEEHGYIVIHPNSVTTFWDKNGSNDAAVFNFIRTTVDAFNADRRRVHFTGFSSGGYMTWRMACAHADTFASVAPMAAAHGCNAPGCLFTGEEPEGTPTPSEQLDVMYFSGTDDAFVDHACVPRQVQSVLDAFGLDSEEMISEDATHRWKRYSNAQGTVFEHVDHDYTTVNPILRGHCFAGSTEPGYACTPPNAYTNGDIVMQFFIDHPMGC